MSIEPAMGRRRRLRVALAIVVSGGLLAWVLWRAEVTRLPELLSGMALPWLWAALGARAASISLRLARYRWLLKAAIQRPPQHVVGACFLGGFATQVLPFRGGEAVRVAVLRRYNNVPLMLLAATVGLERLLDLSTICLGLAVATLLVPLPAWLGVPATVVSAVASAALSFVLFGRSWARSVSVRLPDQVVRHAAAFIDGLGAVGDRRALCVWGGVGGVGWLLEAIAVGCLLICFQAAQPFPVVLLLTCATALGMGVPAGPAGLGPHQFVHVAVLGVYGVSAELALAVSLVSTLATAALMGLGAGLALLRLQRGVADTPLNPSA